MENNSCFEQHGVPIEILLVEDNPGDARLTAISLEQVKIRNVLSVVEDGVEALEYLHKRGKYAAAKRPDLILLDLNLPRMDGRELLAEIKKDESLGLIPVVVLTTSSAEEDIARSYKLHASCYVSKPIDMEEFMKVIHAVESFWLTIVRFPPK